MDRAAEIDLDRLRRGRLGRLRAELKKFDLAACVLLDPVNIRYATGARNMQVFPRTQSRPLSVPAGRGAGGPVRVSGLPSSRPRTCDDRRDPPGDDRVVCRRRPNQAKRWAAEIADLVRARGGGNRRVAIERVNYAAAAALAAHGFVLSDAQEPVERARAIKLPDELTCIRASLAAAEQAVAGMLDALRPGMSENQLWALLHKSVIEQDGD
jgi:Xaa-Pro aminopeptidase